MKAKEYLRQALVLDEQIKQHRREIEKLQSMRGTVPSPGFNEHVSTSQKHDATFVDTIYKIMEEERKEAEKLKRLIELRSEIKDVINELTDPTERNVLWERYIDGQTWQDTASELRISERTAYRIHNEACEHIRVP
jgi:RNA polymerase sigma factor (sigma-70 family)